MKKLRGTENCGELLKNFPDTEKVFSSLGILPMPRKSLVELAKNSNVPLQILLNNLSKETGLEVDWPKISGTKIEYRNTFSASTKLRKGRPENVKKILAVHSGKGGVGKTFIAGSLAYYLSNNDLRIGLLDLDIDCPNVSKLFGLEEKLIAGPAKTCSILNQVQDDRLKILPLQKAGIKIVSMGNILEEEKRPVLWRGPIMAKAIEQLIFDTDWGALDFLIIDLPPGTSDVPLTLLNITKPDGAILVTTAQKLSLIDTAKSQEMFGQFGVPVLGVVENMGGEVFGRGEAGKYFSGTKLAGEIPLKKIYQSAWPEIVLKDKELEACLGNLKMASISLEVLLK